MYPVPFVAYFVECLLRTVRLGVFAPADPHLDNFTSAKNGSELQAAPLNYNTTE